MGCDFLTPPINDIISGNVGITAIIHSINILTHKKCINHKNNHWHSAAVKQHVGRVPGDELTITNTSNQALHCRGTTYTTQLQLRPGPSFIKPDQLDPWIKDQLWNALLSTILSLQLSNFVSCGRACPSHMAQNLVTVGAKLLTGEWFLFGPWSMDQADLVW